MKGHFGIFEMIGSIILLLIDPNRRDNKKYLDPRYLKINRIVGIVIVIIILGVILYQVKKVLLK
ncbi:hypothetical protein [Abyssalbus ytuae]|uniref:Uncharacterized protein n=1 Tax=Abyssalbus ytuae TaxID=2926907 RepID=A0A9E7CTD0_9FLAO|nr:hypothetical protein [Abyssalbus ytuae]UOB17891.1 hypothetical protein MQE35_01010 [Abyssalbus ytuae]